MWWVMVPVAALMGAAAGIPCEEAKMKCAYRVGCGKALQNYVVGCSGVLQGPPPTHCPEVCHHSLIALTSTEEGKALMNCECSDRYCEDQKRRTDVCRPEVLKSISEPVVSCRVAQWICTADTLCSTALEYYNLYCRAMFHGKKCTPRCKNSISILRRQEQAAKLTMCKCDGLEDYDCLGIQRNMEKLCFHKRQHHQHQQSSSTHDGSNNHNNHNYGGGSGGGGGHGNIGEGGNYNNLTEPTTSSILTLPRPTIPPPPPVPPSEDGDGGGAMSLNYNNTRQHFMVLILMVFGALVT